MSEEFTTSAPLLSAAQFRRRFNRLILLTWTGPPVIGLSFLLFIRMFTAEQMGTILVTPLEPIFILGSLALAYWYFRRYSGPIVDFLNDPDTADREAFLSRMRRFPLHYWGIFLTYIVIAPSTVIVSAEYYTDFTAQPVDWFRIHLVALIVSIIVGLPIFFRIIDLFGVALGGTRLDRPHVTIKVKVFLIGAMVPLLIDTMLVQYYWTRTGYFTTETFFVWLSLEMIAIVGSLIAVKSFAQSLQPLQGILAASRSYVPEDLSALQPRSTDELGVLATGFRRLLRNLRSHSEILQIGNRILRSTGQLTTLEDVVQTIIDSCRSAVGGDIIFLILHDAEQDELVGVAQTGTTYNADGHFRLSMEETSSAVWAFKNAESIAIGDVDADPRVSPRMRRRFSVKSTLASPLLVEGRAIGVLMSITSTRRRDYTSEDIQMMEAFAHEVAAAVYTQMLHRERAQAESAQRERDDRIRLLMDSTEEGIFGVDLEGRCIFVNPACLRLLGYASESDLLGRNMHELVHHSHPDGSHYPHEECRVRIASMAGEACHSQDEVHWRADGSSFPVEYWAHPIYNEDRIIGSVVTFVDITERKQKDDELRRLNEYNQLLLESTGEGIFGVDTDMRITFANNAAAGMLGYTTEELQGQHVHTLVHHSREDGTPVAVEEGNIYKTLRAGRSFWTDEEVLWHKAGTSFPVQYSSNPIMEDGRITGAVVVFRNIAEARAMARKMDYLATHDALTGLVNRREFERRLEHSLRSVREENVGHALCYLDLDQFKVVNDTCGHVGGDELLRQLSSLLVHHVRQSDTIARLGGDEFGVLFESCPVDRAASLARDLCDTVRDFRFVWEDKTFSLGVSVGIVAIDTDAESVAAALSAADAACYMAKDSGRNRIHVYQHDDAELAERRGEMQWVTRIHDAFEQDRFRLAFQEIAPADSTRPEGRHVEILVHMRDPAGTRIPPGAFLPAAERYNLMPRIDRWVVANTFRWLQKHSDRLNEIGLCAINLSGHSLGEEQFLRFVVDEIQDTGIPAGKICFEITETAAVANLSRALHFIRELRNYGCRFALDDFGSGMSSFAYLKNLPVDYLKIDGNFVRDLVRDPIDRAMVEAINQVGQVMGIQTVAEFVEDDDILAELRRIGVDYVQGYGIAMPQPLEDLF